LFIVCITLSIAYINGYIDEVAKRKTIKLIMDTMIQKTSDPKEVFKIWHFIHEKQYSIESAEGQEKEAIFIKNYHKVKSHNNEVGKSYTLGLNHFADLTLEEFHEKYLKPNSQVFAEMRASLKSSPKKLLGARINLQSPNIEFSTVNWVDKMLATKVENQRECGSCWAFATSQAVQAAYAIKNNKPISLSKQQLVDCEPKSNGCKGGMLHTALDYVEQNGLETEEDYSYKGVDSKCEFNNKKERVKISGYDVCNENDKSCSNDEDLFKVLSKGPVAAVVDASDEFMLYDGGIFDKPCKEYNHAILVVGFTKKEHEGEDNYWIIKNSWGNFWGDHGYIKIKQSSNYNSCLLNKYYVRPYIN
jgi:C1A family cysteine protease